MQIQNLKLHLNLNFHFKVEKNRKIVLIVLFCLSFILIIPILIYEFSENIHFIKIPLLPKHYYIQTFVSGPSLFISGLTILILKSNIKIKVIGCLIMLFGLYWILEIIKCKLEEAQII